MTCRLHYAPNARWGFTLVELMVTIVIIAILSSLSLAGLNGARQRSKISKTQSTICKLSDALLPHYDSYLRRRLPNSGMSPLMRLSQLRVLIAREIPDGWDDIFPNLATVNALTGSNAYLKTSPIRSYAVFKDSISSPRMQDYGNAECLHLIVSRSGFDSSWIEQFRSDEIGDTDDDKAPEFQDGWGRPIRFIRWAPGFISPIQQLDTPDPLDPLRVSGTPGPPRNPDPRLVPLIFSAGPDGANGVAPEDGYGITGPPTTGWTGLPSPDTDLHTTRPASVTPLPGALSTTDPNAARDNITNHSF